LPLAAERCAARRLRSLSPHPLDHQKSLPRHGGRQKDFTLGLNWYPDVGIRFLANWVHVLELAAPYNRPDINGIHPNLFEVRAQVDW
jgi:phosphate-selective porin